MPRTSAPPGPTPHKSRCRCEPCNARRREAKALAIATGVPAPIADEVFYEKDLLNAKVIIANPRPTERSRIATWLAMRAAEPNLAVNEASRRMGLNPNTLSGMISKAVRDGWLKFDDPMDRIEHQIIPKTLDNLESLLDKHDRTTTIEVAKGTIFRTYAASKGVSDAPQTVLALKIETQGHDQVKVLEGHVVGKARELEE